MSTISAKMGLLISTVGTDSGLLWEQNLNQSLGTIDNHNHSPGNGALIGTSGFSVDAALNFNGFAGTNLSSLVLLTQTSVATPLAFYSVGGNAYYNNASGQPIQLTLGTGVNVTSSGISSGTATAGFVSSVLVVNQNTNTPGNIQAGSILIGNNTAGSNFCTLSVQSALASNYSLVLPTLPSASRFVSLDSIGNMSANGTGDGVTIQVASGVIGIIAGSVGPTQITAGSIGTASIAAGGVATSNIAANAVTAAKLEVAPTVVFGAINQTCAAGSTTISLSSSVSTGTFTTGRPVYMAVTGLVDFYTNSSGTVPANLLTFSFSVKFAGGTPQTYTLSSQTSDFATVISLETAANGGVFPNATQIGSFPAQGLSQLIVTPVNAGNPQVLSTLVASAPTGTQAVLSNFQLAFFQI